MFSPSNQCSEPVSAANQLLAPDLDSPETWDIKHHRGVGFRFTVRCAAFMRVPLFTSMRMGRRVPRRASPVHSRASEPNQACRQRPSTQTTVGARRYYFRFPEGHYASKLKNHKRVPNEEEKKSETRSESIRCFPLRTSVANPSTLHVAAAAEELTESSLAWNASEGNAAFAFARGCHLPL